MNDSEVGINEWRQGRTRVGRDPAPHDSEVGINEWRQGRTRVGGDPAPPSYVYEGGGSFNITSAFMSLPQAIYILHCIALHSPKLKD